MARVSTRAKMYTKGKAAKGYWGTQDLKNILWDIYRTHKSWGDEWYGKAQMGAYESAKVLLVLNAKGAYMYRALDIIDELMERGEE